jgi:outer membrane protein TolC
MSNALRAGAALIFFTAAANAQTALTVQQAVERALATHGLIQAGESRVRAAEGLRQQASLFMNPRLVLQAENLRTYGNPPFQYLRDMDHFAYLQHTFETANRRVLRTELASANVARTEFERETIAAQIRGRVKNAYWAAAGARQIQRWLDEDLIRFGEIVRYHELRVREGAMAESDLLRVRLEQSRLRLAASNARLNAERAAIDLWREMGSRDFPPVEFADSLETMHDPQAPAAGRAEVRLARQIAEQARRNVRLQQALARPNFDLVFGYKRSGALDMMMAGFQIDLPMSNRNQGNVAAAAAEVRAAEATLAAVEAQVNAEAEAARRAVEIRREQLASVIASMRSQAGESQRIADAAYRAGGIELLRLLDAERARIETQVLYYQTLAEYQQAVAALETALGVS